MHDEPSGPIPSRDQFPGLSHEYPHSRAWLEGSCGRVSHIARNQITQANKAFGARAIRHVAEQGVSQFIDLGAGLPTSPSTHQTARATIPDARVAYLDRGPEGCSRALDRRVAMVKGDARDPVAVFTDPVLTGLIDLTEPVCVLLVCVLNLLPADDADAAVAVLREWLVPGSYLVISAATAAHRDPELIRSLQAACGGTGMVATRTETGILAWFDGFSLARPGLADIWAWRPDAAPHPARPLFFQGRLLAGVARKPADICSYLP